MRRQAGEVVLRREADGEVICERCVVADTLPRRLRGLLGRPKLSPGTGIVMRPGWSIHTMFLRFAIDVMFVDTNQVVLKVVPSLRPWRARFCMGAHDVVELAEGECARHGIEAGDRVTWAARRQSRPESLPPENGQAWGTSNANSSTRVLVGTGDERFLRLARFLLTRNNFDVRSTKRVIRAAELVERHEPDVVVIDASDSLGDAARSVAAIEALYPKVGVLVVCDGEPPRWTTGLKVTEKWAALETLPADIRVLTDAKG